MKKPTYYLLTIVSIFFLLLSNSFADPLNIHITSNGDWKTSDTFVNNWETLSFNDSGWDNARSPYPKRTLSNVDILPTEFINDTTAQFIWHDPDNLSTIGMEGVNEVFFRYIFNLDIQLNSLPLLGQALINVDDDYDLFVNGDLIFENHDGGHADLVQFVDFTSSLKNGDNIIAIHAVDGKTSLPSGPLLATGNLYESLLFDATIETVPAPSVPALMFLGLFSLGFLPKEKLKNRI